MVVKIHMFTSHLDLLALEGNQGGVEFDVKREFIVMLDTKTE